MTRSGPTVAIVGDCIASRPLLPLVRRDGAFAATVERLRTADVAIGNLETTIAGLDVPEVAPWGVPEDWLVRAEPGVAADLRALGFDAFARANNHAMDWSVAGMRETARLLDAAGLVHAGTGEGASASAAPAYVESPSGRVALISATTSPSPIDVAPALDPFGAVPARPGVHTLRVEATVQAGTERIAWLRDLRPQIPELSTAWTDGPADLELGRIRFVEGEPSVTYAIDPQDHRRLSRSIRLARSHADVVILMLHVHQGDRPGEPPPAFVRELGREAIDDGADVVAVSGPHRLGPVEVHDGRPILHGLGNFVWSDLHEPLPAYFWERTKGSMGDAAPDPATSTDADLLEVLNADAFDDPEVFRAVIAEISSDGVRLRPVELGYGEPLTLRGIPRIASPEVASEILATIAEGSAPLGTELAIEGGVGMLVLGR